MLALVMSGGGARGAYEVGVLSYLYGQLAGQRPPAFDIVSGTSVGAINGAFLASVAHDPVPGVRRLLEVWRELEMPHVLGFNMVQAQRLHRVLLGGRKGAGLFDASPMTDIIRSEIHYRQIARNIRSGHLRALTVTATHVPTGQPTVFVDKHPSVALPQLSARNVVVRTAHVMPYHVLASAAIPILFPPVFIRTDLYCDGGLRLNTPLGPAIRLGADRVLVIGMTGESNERVEIPPDRFPGLPFLLGKVLDAFLLDHVNLDVEELERVNLLLKDGIAAFGPEFLEKLNAEAAKRGHPPRRLVESLVIRPSRDMGEMAADYLRRERVAIRRKLGRAFLRLMDVGEGADSADMASYLLFDGGFASELIDLGWADAAARHDELEAFLGLGAP
ncbi:MAG: patatin-like phospholipase family protein [Sandaracinaceae bacterium]|nr:MAG: patatin-like phospholipase family protein [Sandaracinaceae bacterium]